MIGAVAPLTFLLVRHGLMEREEAGAAALLQGLLRLQRLHGPREEWPGHDGAGGPLHPANGVLHLGSQLGVSPHFVQRGEVREGLHTVASVDVELLHR